MVGILVSFWDGLFSGTMLVSGRVYFVHIYIYIIYIYISYMYIYTQYIKCILVLSPLTLQSTFKVHGEPFIRKEHKGTPSPNSSEWGARVQAHPNNVLYICSMYLPGIQSNYILQFVYICVYMFTYHSLFGNYGWF